MILELDVTADAANAVASLGDVGDAAKLMADDVQAAASTADTAAGSMDGLAAGADAVDSKMGAATGSLGALAGGLEAAGFEGAAAGLQGVASATDFVSGAGGLLNLVMETQAAKFLLAKGQAVAHTIALGAAKGAAVTSAAAQWLLNAAMSANPIGLIVLALALMAGGLVLAYQKSETFRDIVNAAFGVVKDAIGLVKDAIDLVVQAVKNADGPFDALKNAVDLALTPVKATIDGVKDAVDAVIGAVRALIDWISKIDLPDIDLPGGLFGTRSLFGVGSGGGLGGKDQGPLLGEPTVITIPITVQGDTDPDAAAERILTKLSQYLERQGKTLVVTS